MKNKIGIMFLVVMLALAGIGISYAGFTDTIYIFGEVNTATVEMEVVNYSGTIVYKVWDVPNNENPPNDDMAVYEHENELLIYRGMIDDLPVEQEVIDWAEGLGGYAERISWAYAEQGDADNEIDLIYHNLFPCIEFTADFLFKYTGSIPAKLWAEYEIVEDDDGLLAMLLDEGQITLEAIGSKGIFKDTDTSLEIGSQVHGGEEIYLALTIHVPQHNKYQGLSGSFTSSITALQWNEEYEEEEEVEGITLKATKIICESTDCLPEWGANQNQPAMITEQLINEFLADNPDCYVDPNWEFEYGFDVDDPITNYDDINSQYGYGGSGWNPFSETTFIPLDSIPENTDNICVREVLKDDFIPFIGGTSDSGEGSAELYAHTDGYNFDNLEWIDTNDLVAGGTYYIVGFNVPVEEDCIPPLIPIDPIPSNESIDVDYGSSILLKYKTGHEDGEPINITTYISTDSDPYNNYDYNGRSGPHTITGYTQVTGNHNFETQPDTTYFWQIVVEADCGSETVGPVWQFTTKEAEEDCVEEIDLTKTVWNEVSQNWEDSIHILTDDIITFNITISTPVDACVTCNGYITDFLPAGLDYIDDSTNITIKYNDGSVEYREVEPFKEDFPQTIVGLIWNETNMGGFMQLPPGVTMHLTFNASVWAIDGYLTNAAEINATYDCEQEPILIDSDTASVDVKNPSPEIDTIEDLYAIRHHLDGDYTLMRNLDFQDPTSYENSDNMNDYTTGNGWLPIGESLDYRFKGIFDGSGYTISNLFIDRDTTRYVGLFGVISGPGEIKNLGLIDINVTGDDSVGGLIGFNQYGTVSDSYVTGSESKVSGRIQVGGLTGYSLGSTTNCYAECDVTGDEQHIGGLIGVQSGTGSVVSNSYANGVIIGDYNVGGLIGVSYRETISNCYSTGSISGNGSVGGFIGLAHADNSITNCYSHATVTRVSGYSETIASFCGFNYRGSITNSYSTGSVHYDNEDDPINKGFVGSEDTGTPGNYEDSGNFFDTTTSGQTSTTGNAEPKTTTEMQDFDTFDTAGWDIAEEADWTNESWSIDDGNDYPRLGWQD